MNKQKLDLGIAISSSVLSLGVSAVGYTNFHLDYWWQLILMVPALFITFVVFVVSIELLLLCYERYIKRAHIRITASDRLEELKSTIDSLYAKEMLFEAYKSGAYRDVLEAEIRTLYQKATSTINLLRGYNAATVLKHPADLQDEELFEKYCSACEHIKVQHNFIDPF